MISVVDPESRHARKTVHSCRDGSRARIRARAQHRTRGRSRTQHSQRQRHRDVAARRQPPEPSCLLTAREAGQIHHGLDEADMVAVMKPPTRILAKGGADIGDFGTDTQAGTAACLQGVTAAITPAAPSGSG